MFEINLNTMDINQLIFLLLMIAPIYLSRITEAY